MATVCNLAKETGVSSFSRLIDVTTWLNFQDGFGVAYKNQVRTEMEFSYSQTENFEMEKLSTDTGYFKN